MALSMEEFEYAIYAMRPSSYVNVEMVQKELVCFDSPDKLFERKEMYERLLKETQDLIETILSSPMEIAEALGKTHVRIGKDTIYDYLRKVKKTPRRTIFKVLKELKQYSMSLT